MPIKGLEKSGTWYIVVGFDITFGLWCEFKTFELKLDNDLDIAYARVLLYASLLGECGSCECPHACRQLIARSLLASPATKWATDYSKAALLGSTNVEVRTS